MHYFYKKKNQGYPCRLRYFEFFRNALISQPAKVPKIVFFHYKDEL